MNKRKTIIIIALCLSLFVLFFVALFVGSSKMSIIDACKALFLKSSEANNRIIYRIRLPRILAATVVGASLALAGLIMQTTLNNPMASPSTLGISNAAVFGANLSIIIASGGFLSLGGNLQNYVTTQTPFNTSLFAFLFSLVAIIIILLLSAINKISSTTLILSGIALGAVWTALTTLLQFFASDVGISSSFIWSFGDLSRATYQTDLIISIIFIVCFITSILLWSRFNLLLSGEKIAKSSGLNLRTFRIIALVMASLLTAAAVSFFGIIGFIGIIASATMKRLIGYNHKILIPATAIFGSVILLLADIISRTISNGLNLPVGAITSLIGAPFFLIIILRKKEFDHARN